MADHRYMVLLRNSPGGSRASAPSPEQMQQMFAAYGAWKDRFKESILDMGDKLLPGGRVVTASGVSDGPFAESKELVGGFMIIGADSYEGAVEVVRACPAIEMPGVTMEVRELAGAKM